jgi:hypothetical protein
MEGRPYEKSPIGLSAGAAAALARERALTMTRQESVEQPSQPH